MSATPADFAALMSDFLARCGGAYDPAAAGIEFSADACTARAVPDPDRSGSVLIEIEIGELDVETLAEDAAALLALHRFNAVSEWMFIIDADDTPLLRLVRSIAETDGAMLERLFADGIETALAAAVIARPREVIAAETRFHGIEAGIVRG